MRRWFDAVFVSPQIAEFSQDSVLARGFDVSNNTLTGAVPESLQAVSQATIGNAFPFVRLEVRGMTVNSRRPWLAALHQR
jgi:hypothetical protein